MWRSSGLRSWLMCRHRYRLIARRGPTVRRGDSLDVPRVRRQAGRCERRPLAVFWRTCAITMAVETNSRGQHVNQQANNLDLLEECEYAVSRALAGQNAIMVIRCLAFAAHKCGEDSIELMRAVLIERQISTTAERGQTTSCGAATCSAGSRARKRQATFPVFSSLAWRGAALPRHALCRIAPATSLPTERRWRASSRPTCTARGR